MIGPMLRLSLRQLAGRRRLLLIFLLAALPVVLAVILNAFASDDQDFNTNFIVPFVSVRDTLFPWSLPVEYFRYNRRAVSFGCP